MRRMWIVSINGHRAGAYRGAAHGNRESSYGVARRYLSAARPGDVIRAECRDISAPFRVVDRAAGPELESVR